MVCERCGHDAGEVRFCRECGGAMPVPCSACGSMEPREAKFGGECGEPLCSATPATGPRRPGTPGPRAEAERPKQPSAQAIAADERNASVVFADISDYTVISASHEAGDVLLFLAAWYARVWQIADKYGGFFKRAEGDCVMVVLGAPTACEDHAERACRVALEIRTALPAFVEEYGGLGSGTEGIDLHIGVNTGQVAAGSVEGGEDGAYDVIGHAVNQAKRLQTAAARGTIYVGEDTYRRVGSLFVWQELAPLSLKGLEGDTKAHELLGARQHRVRLPDSATPFVGREKELAELRAAAALASAGEGQIVTIGGDPGIGKSRLLQELAGDLEAQGFQVVLAHSFPDEQAIPYHGLAQILRSVLEIAPASGDGHAACPSAESLAELGVEGPEDATRVQRLLGSGDPPDGEGEAEERQRLTRRAVRRILMAAADKRPIGLLVEDLQWTDALTLDFLSHIVHWTTERSILLAATFRPGAKPSWASVPHGRAIILQALSPDESVALARAAARGDDSERSLCETVVDRAGGNPLFIQELSRAGLTEASGEVPATIRDVIMARLGRLPPEERRFLTIAATVGPRFPLAVVLTAARQTSTGFPWLAESLVRTGWLRPALPADDSVYEFDHMLARDVAYGSLLRRDRVSLHRRVAEIVEAMVGDDERPEGLAGDPAEIIAHHYFESDARERAAPYLLEAMRRADRQDAPQSVVAYGEQLQDVFETCDGIEEGSDVLFEALGLHGRACALMGRNQAATSLLARQARLAEELGAEDALAMSRFLAGRVFLSMANFDQAIEEMSAAKAFWEQQGSADLVFYARLGLAGTQARRGEYEAALEEFRVCLAGSEEDVAAPLRGAVHHNYGEVCAYLGRLDEALEHFDRAEALTAGMQTPDARLLANIHGGRGKALLSKGRCHQAQESFGKAAELARQSGDMALHAEVLIDLGQCHRRLGEIDEAASSLRAGIEAARDAEAPSLVAIGEASLARNYLLTGEAELARSTAEDSLARGRSLGDRAPMYLAQRVLGDIAEREERHDDGVRLRLQMVALALELGRQKDEASGFIDLSRSYQILGQLPEARSCLARALTMAREMGTQHLISLAAGRLADVCLDLGLPREAADHAKEGMAAADGQESDELAWRCHFAMARVMEAGGMLETAATHFEAMLSCLNASCSQGGQAWYMADLYEALAAAEEFYAGDGMPAHVADALVSVRALVEGLGHTWCTSTEQES